MGHLFGGESFVSVLGGAGQGRYVCMYVIVHVCGFEHEREAQPCAARAWQVGCHPVVPAYVLWVCLWRWCSFCRVLALQIASTRCRS